MSKYFMDVQFYFPVTTIIYHSSAVRDYPIQTIAKIVKAAAVLLAAIFECLALPLTAPIYWMSHCCFANRAVRVEEDPVLEEQKAKLAEAELAEAKLEEGKLLARFLKQELERADKTHRGLEELRKQYPETAAKFVPSP